MNRAVVCKKWTNSLNEGDSPPTPHNGKLIHENLAKYLSSVESFPQVEEKRTNLSNHS